MTSYDCHKQDWNCRGVWLLSFPKESFRFQEHPDAVRGVLKSGFRCGSRRNALDDCSDLQATTQSRHIAEKLSRQKGEAKESPPPPPPKECVVSNAGVCCSLSSTHTLLALYFEQGFARGLSTRRRECPSRQRNPKCTSLGNVLQHECEYEELVLDLTNWVVPRYNLPCKVRARASRLY